MVRLKGLNRRRSNEVGKENAPENVAGESDSSNRKRRPRFRRKSKQEHESNDVNVYANGSSETSVTAASQPESIPHFSSMADLAILHNSVSTSKDQDQLLGDSQDSASGSLSLSLSSSVFRSRTENAMRFALQSRMYEEKNTNYNGNGSTNSNGNSNGNSNTNYNIYDKWENLGEDPTVEESIECVFEHQLEEGLELNVEDDTDSINDIAGMSLNNSDDVYGNGYGYDYGCAPQKYYTSGKLTHVASYSPFLKKTKDDCAWIEDSLSASRSRSPGNTPTSTRTGTLSTPRATRKSPFRPRSAPVASTTRTTTATRIHSRRSVKTNTNTPKKLEFYSCNVCKDGTRPYLGISPEEWPQAPLLLRPCPGSGTKIIGVRYADSDEYLHTQWWNETPHNTDANNASDANASANANANAKEDTTNTKNTYCEQCCCLPINNGNEPSGKTLVVDFESKYFQGTLQLRIRHSNGTTPQPYDDSQGYFHGFNRQYQSIIQGRFTKEGMPMTRCLAGQTYKDSLKLPPAYVVKGGMRIIHFFAPRLNAKVDGRKPYIFSPLGSTPQNVMVDPWNAEDGRMFRVEGKEGNKLVEPVEESRKLIPYKSHNPSSSVTRAKARKKAFDKLCADGDESLTFRTDRVYTFESLQHLVDFRPFEVDLGKILGRKNLSPIFDGQPMNIMAAYQPSSSRKDGGEKNKNKGAEGLEKFWSFEIWHERMIDRMLQKNA